MSLYAYRDTPNRRIPRNTLVNAPKGAIYVDIAGRTYIKNEASFTYVGMESEMNLGALDDSTLFEFFQEREREFVSVGSLLELARAELKRRGVANP